MIYNVQYCSLKNVGNGKYDTFRVAFLGIGATPPPQGPAPFLF